MVIQVTTPLLFKLIPSVMNLGVLLQWFPTESSTQNEVCCLSLSLWAYAVLVRLFTYMLIYRDKHVDCWIICFSSENKPKNFTLYWAVPTVKMKLPVVGTTINPNHTSTLFNVDFWSKNCILRVLFWSMLGFVKCFGTCRAWTQVCNS